MGSHQLALQRMSCLAGGLAAAVLTMALAGCSDGMADVTGKVTLDGQPLGSGNGIRATVFFQPASGAGAAAVGILNSDGEYTLSSGSKEGVAPGEYKVTCTATRVIPSQDPGGAPSGKRITDPKYANAQTSGWQFTVEPGQNTFDLSLVSSQSRAVGSR